MNEELTKAQKELLELFYSKNKTKVLFVKRERNNLWDTVTGSENIDPENLAEICEKCPAIMYEIKKSKENGKNIQSAVFSECVYAQTLANMFNLEFVQNKCDNLPVDIRNFLGEHCLHIRYYYSNSQNTVLLFQAGSKNGVDCCLYIDNNGKHNFYTIEFKENYAKSSEPDLPEYGENGIMVVDNKFLDMYPHFKQMLDEKTGLNFFDTMGSNIHGFSEESVRIAVDRNYIKKPADVIVTESRKGILIMLPSTHISQWADIHGEIRPAGRNPYKVWTPDKAKEIIEQKGGKIENNLVTIKKSYLEPRKSRGNKKRISGYKTAPLFFVKIEKCTDNGSSICFKFDDLQQLKPTISGIIDFRKCIYEDIKQSYEK